MVLWKQYNIFDNDLIMNFDPNNKKYKFEEQEDSEMQEASFADEVDEVNEEAGNN